MAFSETIAAAIAFRSAYICNYGECNALTIGPSQADPALKIKIGEAAHIIGQQPTSARYEHGRDTFIASAENGLWLCASCHRMVDKNRGADFTTEELFEWKAKHEEVIDVLLRTHRSPLPLIRRMSQNAKIAQDIVDLLDGQSVMYVSAHLENADHVVKSYAYIRKELGRLKRKIVLDQELRETCDILREEFRQAMSATSANPTPCDIKAWVESVRFKTKQNLVTLEKLYGCKVPIRLK